MTATAGNRWVTVNFQIDWPKNSSALSVSSCTLMCPLRFLAIRGCRTCSGNNVPAIFSQIARMEEKENILRSHGQQIQSPFDLVAWASAHWLLADSPLPRCVSEGLLSKKLPHLSHTDVSGCHNSAAETGR